MRRLVWWQLLNSSLLHVAEQVAPYNTFYPKLEADLAQVGVDATVNSWDRLLTLGLIDPHDSISHPAGVADAQAEGPVLLQPERFTNFAVCIFFTCPCFEVLADFLLVTSFLSL